ncbi:MAG: hypothetical protein GXO37_06835 [Chloroflexi bacterium]|nr:hypothetical protein [Chloroflexota bacterium]
MSSIRFKRLMLLMGLLGVLGLTACTRAPTTPTPGDAKSQPVGTPIAAATPADAAIAEARAALEAWLEALRAGRCEDVLAGLAQNSPLWAGREALDKACREGGEAVERWKALRVGEGSALPDGRVVFRLQDHGTQAYAIMVQEDGQWRYAGDVFSEWTPRPAECANETLHALWGPVWDRGAAVTVGLTLTNQGAETLTWETPCARLRWPDGHEVEAQNCPAGIALAPGETWRGELLFPKPEAERGHPWQEPPNRIWIESLRAGDESLDLVCTWRGGP